ncbi:MAG: sugar phosphate nucleotidyltransferase [Elainellaceae cyanobacterium]
MSDSPSYADAAGAQNPAFPMRVVGLIPAGGVGSRISPLPGSKELFPIGFQTVGDRPGLRPKVVSHYLMEKMRWAGITEAFVILRPGKWDIPAYFGDGAGAGLHLAYLTIHVPYGVPFSLDQAYPFVRDAAVAIGFPDILFSPDDAYGRLLRRLFAGEADVVLGLFPTDQPDKVGVVDYDATGRVTAILEKSTRTDLPHMWAIAVWKPSFTEFLHGFVQSRLDATVGDRIPQWLSSLPERAEIPIGDVIQAAIERGLQVEAEVFEDGSYLDIGTPENLAQAIRLGF